MRSPLTLLTASLRPSTRAAISLANRILPSSRILSASSRLPVSSISSLVNLIFPLNKKLLSTGEFAKCTLAKRLCRYERSVSLFLSLASLEGAPGRAFEADESEEEVESKDWAVDSLEMAGCDGGAVGAATVLRSLAGGGGIGSSG
jgi:hypothetical protein